MFVYGNRDAAFAAAGASDHIYSVVNPAGVQCFSVSGGTITAGTFDHSVNHVMRLK